MLKRIIQILKREFTRIFLVSGEILALEERLKRCTSLTEIEIVQREYFSNIK